MEVTCFGYTNSQVNCKDNVLLLQVPEHVKQLLSPLRSKVTVQGVASLVWWENNSSATVTSITDESCAVFPLNLCLSVCQITFIVTVCITHMLWCGLCHCMGCNNKDIIHSPYGIWVSSAWLRLERVDVTKAAGLNCGTLSKRVKPLVDPSTTVHPAGWLKTGTKM